MDETRCEALVDLGLHYRGALEAAETFESPMSHRALAALRGYVMRPIEQSNKGTKLGLRWDTAVSGNPARAVVGFHADAIENGKCRNIAIGGSQSDLAAVKYDAYIRGASLVHLRPLSRALRSIGGGASLLPALGLILAAMSKTDSREMASLALVRMFRAFSRLARDSSMRASWHAAAGTYVIMRTILCNGSNMLHESMQLNGDDEKSKIPEFVYES